MVVGMASDGLLESRVVDRLEVAIYSSRSDMGKAAAQAVGRSLKRLLQEQPVVNMVFAAAPSQNEFLGALAEIPGIEWERVVAFHLDEYIGLPQDAPQRFANYLNQHIFRKVPFKAIHYLNGNADNLEAECERYAGLLKQHLLDIACIGIGENGHIAFNDPPVADFSDPKLVKVVELDEACRRQQVHDGCFASLEDVPTHALTLTVPAIMGAKEIHCIVPAATKKEAVRAALFESVSTKCPASILRRHKNAFLYLDPDSSEAIR